MRKKEEYSSKMNLKQLLRFATNPVEKLDIFRSYYLNGDSKKNCTLYEIAESVDLLFRALQVNKEDSLLKEYLYKVRNKN